MPTSESIAYRTVSIEGHNVFYREAGPSQAPTLLLLHGFPSSSRMFDTLMPLLADRYRLVAPDYPGFGHSDAQRAERFVYTFDHIADIIDKFTVAVNVRNYVLYMQDYGGPVGFRLAISHPDRVRAMIIQNAVAHERGLGPLWDERRAYWKDRVAYEDKVISNFISLKAARERHVGSSPHIERYNPDTWTDEFAALSRPDQTKIQADLFYDYQTNVSSYPGWQAWFRAHHPKMLVLWGKYDPSFAIAGAAAYKEDVPDAEIHILDAGHFALDEKVDEISRLIRAFLENHQITD
jgi:pimeloyl-ACP methyl ester carboxylesterase